MTAKTVAQHIQERKERGAAILAADASAVAQVSHFRFLVRGSGGDDYSVDFENGARCTCEDFRRHGATLRTCKHIESARLFANAAEMIERDGEQVATLRAIVEASRGDALHQARWQAVLNILKAGHNTPAAVIPFPARRATVKAVA